MYTTRPIPRSHLTCLLRAAALLLVVSITLGIAFFQDHLSDFTALGYLGAFTAMLLGNATLVLPAPGLLVVFALGSTLNPLLVGIVGGLGATLGELTGYLTGYSGVGLMEHNTISARVHRWMDRSGALTIFVLSIIPNPFFDLAGIIAGMGRMPLIRFLSITFFGKTIQSTLVAIAGTLSIHWVETWLTH
ncbi:MAG: VTT domain-containing protein [Anaerolineae bacterium]|nr:VTT domain-containing protein [Anaerolineae bacterium]